MHSHNHLWINVQPDRTCHIGVDRFLVGILREVEALSYVTTCGTTLPTAVLTVRGVDLQLVFPTPIQLTSVNTYLRGRPARLLSHPYTFGWLFEGTVPWNFRELQRKSSDDDFVGSSQHREWMDQEQRRLNEYVRNELVPSRSKDFTTMLDGGTLRDDLICCLTRDEILRLFNEFFSPVARHRSSV